MVAKAASKAPAPKAAAGSHAAQKGAAGHHGPPKAAAGSHASPAVKKVAAEKGEKVERPTKPDEDKYKSDLATAEKELEEAKKKVVS